MRRTRTRLGITTKRPFATLLGMTVMGLMVADCIPYRGQPNPEVGAPNDYAGAAVMAATGVGAAAAHRKLFGGCYAVCSPGYYCDQSSGFCKKIEECNDSTSRNIFGCAQSAATAPAYDAGASGGSVPAEDAPPH